MLVLLLVLTLILLVVILSIPSSGRKFHVVVARYDEDTSSWIKKLDKNVVESVIVYDKSKNQEHHDDDPRVTVKTLPNVGRETDTYLNYIYENYENLPDHIVFTQGDPFPHSPNFLEIVNTKLPKMMNETFVPLTIRYIPNFPPDDVIEKYKTNNVYCLYHTNCVDNKNVEWDEFDWNPIDLNYRAFRMLGKEENVFFHFSQEAGIPFDKDRKTLPFFYSAIFYTHADNIRKYPREQYKKWIELNKLNLSYGYLFEKMWYYLFTSTSAD